MGDPCFQSWYLPALKELTCETISVNLRERDIQPWNEERAAVGNGLQLFPVSRSRIPNISDFCKKRNANSQTRSAQTVWICVSMQNSEI